MSNSIFDGSLPSSGISRMVHEWTKTYPDVLPHRLQETATSVSPWAKWLSQTGIPLPDVTEALSNTHTTNREAILYRRSIRVYDERPFTTADLSRLLTTVSLSSVADEDRLPYSGIHPRTPQGSLCKLSLLALKVDDLASGAYLFDDATHALYVVRPESPLPIVEETCFQREFNVANVIFMVTGSIRKALDLYGDRGYRYMLIEAGTILSRLYFASGALAMSGSTTGSFAFGALERWVGFDGYNQALTVNFAIGHRPAF